MCVYSYWLKSNNKYLIWTNEWLKHVAHRVIFCWPFKPFHREAAAAAAANRYFCWNRFINHVLILFMIIVNLSTQIVIGFEIYVWIISFFPFGFAKIRINMMNTISKTHLKSSTKWICSLLMFASIFRFSIDFSFLICLCFSHIIEIATAFTNQRPIEMKDETQTQNSLRIRERKKWENMFFAFLSDSTALQFKSLSLFLSLVYFPAPFTLPFPNFSIYQFINLSFGLVFSADFSLRIGSSSYQLTK